MRIISKVLKSVITLMFIFTFSGTIVSASEYISLEDNSIEFGGDFIIFNGETIELNEKAFFIDGGLSEEVADKYEFVFTSINEAVENLTDGTEEEPMVLYIAPYVYWIDNPDDEEVRNPDTMPVPYGLIIDCQWLTFYGLTDNAQNVVIATNRGQTQGANGNFTNLYINGDGLRMENLTVGNYCNVDLEFPLKPELNREKRTNTITQAQLVHSNGDKIVAVNTNFISRLNANPIISDKRVLLYRCHVESTDDALNATTVHLESTFDFYGNRPFYATRGTGAVFLNCEFNSKIFGIEAEPNQFLTKEGGPITIVDSKFKSNYSIPVNISWTKYPKEFLRSYQYNVTHNGEKIYLSSDNPFTTVDMTDKDVLSAYRIKYNDEVIYNTYNLLRGDDDWDPMGIKDIIISASKEDGIDYTSIPTMLSIQADKNIIESRKDFATLTYQVQRFGQVETTLDDITWSIDEVNKEVAQIFVNDDGTCTIIGTNDYEEARNVIVYAKSSTGLEAGYSIEVLPSILPAPNFIEEPTIENDHSGKVKVNYSLDLGDRQDQSIITWYRSTDIRGTNPVEVAVTNLDMPEYEYELTLGDIGYYIVAEVKPKHIRSEALEGFKVVTTEPILESDVKKYSISTDFQNFSSTYNANRLAGFWTVDSFKPLDTNEFEWEPNTEKAWTYGLAIDGAVGTGLYQTTQGARLLYTPLSAEYGDMTVTVNLDPTKTQGQGFGSAKAQYLDVYIKFDTFTLTGYALRIERTAKSSRAVDFSLVKYENGKTTVISEPITASTYLTDCTITLKVVGDKLIAHVETSSPQLPEQTEDGLPHTVDLEATIVPNTFGGSGLQHTGTTGSNGVGNVTMLHSMSVEWDNIEELLKLEKLDKKINVIYNGQEKEYDAIVHNNNYYIRVNKLVKESFKGEILWNQETAERTIIIGEDKLIFTNNSKTIKFNEEEKTLNSDTEILVKDNYTYVPVEFIADIFGLEYSSN